MARYVNQFDALQDPKKYGDISRIPVDYHPNFGMRLLEGKGIDAKTANTEEFHTWYAVIFEGELYYVSANPSELTLKVTAGKGKAWYKQAIKCQQEYSELYESTRFGTKGYPLNRCFLEALPMFIKARYDNCWLTDLTEWCGNTGLMFFIFHNSDHSPEYDFTVCNCGTGGRAARFVPIVKVPKDMMVDLDREFDHLLKIATPEMLAK